MSKFACCALRGERLRDNRFAGGAFLRALGASGLFAALHGQLDGHMRRRTHNAGRAVRIGRTVALDQALQDEKELFQQHVADPVVIDGLMLRPLCFASMSWRRAIGFVGERSYAAVY